MVAAQSPLPLSILAAARFDSGIGLSGDGVRLDVASRPMGGNARMISTRPAIPKQLYRAHDDSDTGGLRAGTSLDAGTFSAVRRRAMLEGYKWDAQVGDVATLAPFPLVMKKAVWNRLAFWAEQLPTE